MAFKYVFSFTASFVFCILLLRMWRHLLKSKGDYNMYKIGEYIMYSNSGVCKVLDICTLPYSKNERDLCYMLQPAFDNKSKIYIPVSSDKVFMRRIYTKSEVKKLIESMAKLKPLWVNDKKEREFKFKETLKSHDTKNCMRMLKGLYLEKQAKNADGKTLSNADSSLFSFTEKLLFGEFAVALQLPIESITKYIDTCLAEV